MKKTYKVTDIFKGKEITYRDSYLDSYLAKELPIHPKAKSVSHFDLTKTMTFKEMAKEFIGSDDVKKVKPCCFSLPEIEAIIKTENKQLLTNGYANFFFIESNNEIFVLYVYRNSDGWFVRVFRLDRGSRWRADVRLFLRNFDSGKLGPLDSDFESRLSSLEQSIEEIRKHLIF